MFISLHHLLSFLALSNSCPFDNGNDEINRCHAGNIQHPLTQQLWLPSLEIYTIFLLKDFFRKIDFLSLLTAIAFSSTDSNFLLNISFKLMRRFNILIIYVICATHFSFCCCWRISCDVFFVICL